MQSVCEINTPWVFQLLSGHLSANLETRAAGFGTLEKHQRRRDECLFHRHRYEYRASLQTSVCCVSMPTGRDCRFSSGAKYCTPKIGTSESIVDFSCIFQWVSIGIFRWIFTLVSSHGQRADVRVGRRLRKLGAVAPGLGAPALTASAQREKRREASKGQRRGKDERERERERERAEKEF